MLKALRLENIILIESTEILFHMGLNVISGETGSGKSAIMNALNHLAGERADGSVIRRGAEKGVIEALFDIERLPFIESMLKESGIDHETGQELIVKREIHSSGKNRAFINNQSVQIALLKRVSAFLFDMIGQHANQRLLNLDEHRRIVDSFGELENNVSTFAALWKEENVINEQIENLINSEAKRLREIETLRMEIDELQEAALQEGEEEALFSEYTLLSNSEELLGKVNEVAQTLSGERTSIIKALNRLRLLIKQISQIDPTLNEIAISFENASLEIEEAAHLLNRYQSRIECNPARTQSINERLSLINRLKRKYGNSFAEIQTYFKTIQFRLKQLENADNDLETLRDKFSEIQTRVNQAADSLTEKRKYASKQLEKEVVTHLRSLNMPQVEFHVEITAQPTTSSGNDKIEFFISPNKGEKTISIRDCASGGELSRILLSMQVLLAGKEKIPSLIFDEIDSNIGGETASVIGEKLREIGTQHQVLCITHFAQVARHAHHHLQISKQEKSGRTVTIVKQLDESSRDQEFIRMSGGLK